MAIRVEERFSVRASPATVWDFLVDPHRVVGCVPGGALDAVEDPRTFAGSVRMRVGPFALTYRGRVRLAAVDEAARRVTIVGQALDRGGFDSARLTLESTVFAVPGAGTEIEARARVDVEGRVVELGRGPLEQLGHVVFQEFAGAVRARIEAAEVARSSTPAGAEPAPGLVDAPAPPLRPVPLVLRALRAWVAGWFRRSR